MEAQFLLRRCPSTPLVIYPSRSTSPKLLGTQAIKNLGNQNLAKLPSVPLEDKTENIRPLKKSSLIISEDDMAHTQPSTIFSTAPPEMKIACTQSPESLSQGSKPKAILLQNSSQDPPDSAKLLQWYFLAQKSPSKRTRGEGTPTDVNSGHKGKVQVEEEADILPSFSSSPKIKYEPGLTSQNTSPKAMDSLVSKSFDEKPLPLPQRRKMNETAFDETAAGTRNAGMYLAEYAPSTDQSDKPKRPFLKRKSIVMPSQKLDWSKVKPMVSSRLEPELKTKLSFCKGTTKEITKTSSKKKKANYSQVKSRLFSYEDNLSPQGSRDGHGFQAHCRETGEAENLQVLRSMTRGSSTENLRNARALLHRHRAASPDFMNLKRQKEADMESERTMKYAETSMLETQGLDTYSSRFNSARYLHKLGNSEHASKAALIGSSQQQPQRIRLRILPRSKENEVGGLFLHEFNAHERIQQIWDDPGPDDFEKGTGQQRHSHRYAIFQDTTQGDVRPSSRPSETTRPSTSFDCRRVTPTFSSKEKDQLGEEMYKYLRSN